MSPQHTAFRPRHLFTLGTVAVAALATSASALAAPATGGTDRAGAGSVAIPASSDEHSTYQNAVSDSFSDTYADPAVILAKDGWWYAYATADPLYAGDPPGIGHIARTKDWADWEYLGTIFDETNRPDWAEPNAGLWAPDIRYIDGQYVIYFTVTDTTLNPGRDPAIGVATSADPAGPFVPLDEPIVAPRPGPNNDWFWTYDPSGFTSSDGRQWLYFGSYYGGLHVVETSPDGLTPIGESTQITVWDRYEGAYVVEHDGWYYLQGSSADCCAGPSTGYSVFSGRSANPDGPFLDADGLDLNASVTGGTTMLTQNGNTFVGAGHHSIMTDATGADFVVYHAIDKNVPWLNEPFGINRRPMLIDRLDWIDGWPVTRAGEGPSDTPQPLPVTDSLLGGDPADPAPQFEGMTQGSDPQAGVTGVVENLAWSTTDAPAGAARVRLDVRADERVTLTLGGFPSNVQVRVDPAAGELRTTLVGTGLTRGSKQVLDHDAQPLTSGNGWRTLVVEVDGDSVRTQISADDLKSPMAVSSVSSPSFSLPAAPVRISGTGVSVDNLYVQTLARDATELAPTPQPGAVIFGEDFDGDLDEGWAWVREDPNVTIEDGDLVWPLRSVDLVGGNNSAPLLLRDVPEGDWIVETNFTLDLGEETVRNYQQAGLIVHENDDDFARLGSVAIWNTRTVEYGREQAAAPGAGTRYAGAIIGAPAPTMAMRIAHTTNEAGEQVYRAGISRDGESWVWGAAWSMPADATPRVGLYTGGGANPPVSARFHDVTFYEVSP